MKRPLCLWVRDGYPRPCDPKTVPVCVNCRKALLDRVRTDAQVADALYAMTRTVA